MTEGIRRLDELSKKDVAIAGGKGASLGEMTQAGLPVPPGFVVLADAFDRFLHEAGLLEEVTAQLEHLNHEDLAAIERASRVLRQLITDAPFPAGLGEDIRTAFRDLGCRFVAVRSSATAEDSSSASWAGELETYLNTTEETLLRNVQRCWASLFTPRAIAYRHEQGLRSARVSVAVVVQQMVESEIAGIAFTVHPVTEDRDQMVIEACWGLGELIVGGQLTPDTYIVDKRDGSVVDASVHEQSEMLVRGSQENERVVVPVERRAQRKLTSNRLQELARLCTRVEQHYGFPCDIEWAFADGTFRLVQSRPITTITPVSEAPVPAPRVAVRYEKVHARDFTLAQIEAWSWGESQGPRQWTLEQQPHQPYLVFERTPDTVYCYAHPLGLPWVAQQLRLEHSRRPTFAHDVVQGYLDRVEWIRPVWNEERVLDHGNLVRFLTELHECWAWYDGMIELLEFLGPDLSEEDRRFAESVRTEDRGGVGTDAVIRKSIAHCFPSFARYVTVLRAEEITEETLPSIEELERRLRGFFYANGELLVGVGRAAIEAKFGITLPNEVVEANVEMLRGQSASRGVARGKVRRVFRQEQVAVFESGAVIVSPMTTPDFLPAMKNSVAFVTDEGGVTCHAAIVARELGKPCVIGTKHATTVLRDGDEVEVDADHGVVRILKRAS